MLRSIRAPANYWSGLLKPTGGHQPREILGEYCAASTSRKSPRLHCTFVHPLSTLPKTQHCIDSQTASLCEELAFVGAFPYHTGSIPWNKNSYPNDPRCIECGDERNSPDLASEVRTLWE